MPIQILDLLSTRDTRIESDAMAIAFAHPVALWNDLKALRARIAELERERDALKKENTELKWAYEYAINRD